MASEFVGTIGLQAAELAAGDRVPDVLGYRSASNAWAEQGSYMRSADFIPSCHS